MSDFLANWLELREPADVAARSAVLTEAVAGAITAGQGDTVRVLDLGTGTGSNLRYVVDRLPARQSWLVVDRDETLLRLLPARTADWGESRKRRLETDGTETVIRGSRLECRVETRCVNLDTLETLNIFDDRHLVTASALLDLVSEEWLRVLAGRCRDVGAAALFALNYTGHSSFSPVEPEDDTIRQLLNRHQNRDKSLGGPAAGPDGATCAERSFAEVGFQVRTAASDWVLGSAEDRLQRQLIKGWAEAATETAPAEASRIWDWCARRLAHVESKRSRVVVSHVDLAAWLP